MRESFADFCHREHYESLLEEWDHDRNLPLTPETVTRGSKRHSWQATLYSRTGSGTGCPYCAGRKPIPSENDLATLYPDLVREWHPTKNGDLTPDRLLPGSHRSVWWQCNHGHVWRAQVKSRTLGAGCPVCANRTSRVGDNDLATRYPDIACQWHPTKNAASHR